METKPKSLIATYALAELAWPAGPNKTVPHGRFCTPAHFESDDQSDWSLCLYFSYPFSPGDTITVPVMPLVSEAAERLLLPDAKFRLFLGRDYYAEGRIVRVQQDSSEEMRRIFHLFGHHG